MDNIETYRSMLVINKHALDDALEVQADVMDRISQQVTSASARSSKMHDAFRQAEAVAFIERKTAGDSDKVADINTKQDPFRTKAFALATQAKAELEEWQGLYEAWKSRGFALKELVSLYGTSYFSANPAHNIERPGSRPIIARRDYTKAAEGETYTMIPDPPSRARRRAT